MVKIDELAALVGATIEQTDDRAIDGVASLIEAGPTDISFFHNARYVNQLGRTKAGAVLVPLDVDTEALPQGPCYLRVENPSMAFAAVVERFTPPRPPKLFGVHPRAVVEDGAEFDAAEVGIGPGAVISAGARIGRGTIIGANVFIGPGVTIGEDCRFHPGVVICEYCRIGSRVILHGNVVIGADGFGYEMDGGKHRKIEQVGIVQIDDDVEIGACSTVDRARFGRTWIGEGTKIDNLVQIGHNCVVGKHCVIVSQSGISGSTRVGNHVTIAASVGIAGHLQIGDKVVLMARSGVTKDIPEPGYYMGFPARPASEVRREVAASRMIPDIITRLRKLEKSPPPAT